MCVCACMHVCVCACAPWEIQEGFLGEMMCVCVCVCVCAHVCALRDSGRLPRRCVCVYACVHACMCARTCVCALCPTLYHPMDCSSPGSSLHGILQAGIVGWVAMPFSRGTFPTQGSNSRLLPASPACVSCIGRWILHHWATWENPNILYSDHF